MFKNYNILYLKRDEEKIFNFVKLSNYLLYLAFGIIILFAIIENPNGADMFFIDL